jgi:hypothetical protein
LVDFRVLESLDRAFAMGQPVLALAYQAAGELLASDNAAEVARGLRYFTQLQGHALARRAQDVAVVRGALEAQGTTVYEQYRAALENSSGEVRSAEQLNQRVWAEKGRPAGLGDPGAGVTDAPATRADQPA